MGELTMRQLIEEMEQAVAEADLAVRRAQRPANGTVGIQPQLVIEDATFRIHCATPALAGASSPASGAAEGELEVGGLPVAVDALALQGVTQRHTVSFTVGDHPVQRVEIDGRSRVVSVAGDECQ
ncbi:hypothetical protein ACWDYJ_33135 [Streptomyces sp. NPDC003042]